MAQADGGEGGTPGKELFADMVEIMNEAARNNGEIQSCLYVCLPLFSFLMLLVLGRAKRNILLPILSFLSIPIAIYSC